jgi:hypothetical protein
MYHQKAESSVTPDTFVELNMLEYTRMLKFSIDAIRSIQANKSLTDQSVILHLDEVLLLVLLLKCGYWLL